MRSRGPGVGQLEIPDPPLEGRLAAVVRERPEEVTRILAPILSEERRARIEGVLGGRTREVVVVLDHLSDPHNAAAVLRTAEGLGLQEVHAIEPGGALPLSRRVTQGCHKWLDIVVQREASPVVDALGQLGYTLLAATERARQGPASYRDLRRVALCMGNEHEGLSAEVAAACEGEVGIPMAGFTRSLNVSVATALLLSGLLEGRRRGLPEAELEALRARYYIQSVKTPLELLERGGVA